MSEKPMIFRISIENVYAPIRNLGSCESADHQKVPFMFTARTFMRLRALAALTGLLLLVGCASEPPRELLSQADIAIQDAERAGTSQYEPELLSSARAKFNRANKKVADDENEEARRMAEEAIAEATLANAKAEAAKEAKQADEMKKAIEALKQEASRESEGR